MADQPPRDPALRIAFRLDASPRIGGGHVMRCLTLAGELARGGADIRFLAATLPAALHSLVARAGFGLVELVPDGEADSRGWDREAWSHARQHDDAARCIAALGDARPDWIVVDHYGLDAHWAGRLRPHVGRIAAIDDLANRAHDCDLLLDQTYGRDAADYRALVPPGATILAGATYALLRPDFADARQQALVRRAVGGAVQRVLVSLGMTDVGGLTEPAIRAALSATEAMVDVVLGSAAPTLPELQALAAREPRVRLHVDTSEVHALMAAADLAIGAAGSTSWERCCMGLPAITLVLADNQRLIAAKLDEAGAIEVATAGSLADALRRLSADAAARGAMARAAAAICDGHGAARVAGRMRATEGG